MKISSIFHYLFRCIFCLSLIVLSYKNLKTPQMNKKLFTGNLDKLERIMRAKNIKIKLIKSIKANADAVILLPICLMILTSIFSLFNLPLSKSCALLSVILHILFFNNCFLDPQRKVVFKASIYLGLYGALSAF